MKRTVLLSILLHAVISTAVTPPSIQAETYVTWEGIEIDKCATAWLIKRFVDPKAEFVFVPKGEIVKTGVPLDIPQAEIRRRHNLSAYEFAMKKYGLKDPALKRIEKFIHSAEINYWQKQETEAAAFIDAFRKAAGDLGDSKAALERGFGFFDDWYMRQSDR